jgi:hypothetical protein
LGDINNRNVLSLSAGNWKSQIEVAGGLVLSEDCEGDSAPCLSLALAGLLEILGVLWLVNSLPDLSLIFPCFLCVPVLKFSLSIRTPVTLEQRPSPLQYELMLLISATTLF